MAARDARKNFTLTVDGRGYAGQIEDFTPPKIALKTEEFRGGGMDAPIELTMGMEKLEASFTLLAVDRDILAMWDVAEGRIVPFTAREALESYDGTITPVVHTMRGKIREIDHGTIKPGDKSSLKITMAVTYYKLQHGANVLQEIDVENMVRIINGRDTMASQRAALGL
nr:MAG TPA: tail tube protein [Caudoviricetes sp.]